MVAPLPNGSVQDFNASNIEVPALDALLFVTFEVSEAFGSTGGTDAFDSFEAAIASL